MVTRIIPPAWLVDARMSRIILHWTAGSHTASAADLAHYHVIIESTPAGIILRRGTHSIAQNERPIATKSYAAHTRLLNSGSIGVAVCAMGGAVERPYHPGRWPITDAQWRALYAVCADLCEHYGLDPIPAELCSHAEVQRVHGVRQAGKWDITVTRDGRHTTAEAAGNEIRREVASVLVRPAPIAAAAREARA